MHRPSITAILLLLCAASALSSAIRKDDENAEKHKTSNDRVKHQEMSDVKHMDQDADGDDDDGEDHHNTDYDHEAFLGREEARTFDQLTPEESVERLGDIVDKIDKNGDEFVTEEELVDWIKHVQNRYIETDTERQWGEHDVEEDGEKLKWESYRKRTYGVEDENEVDDDDGYNLGDMLKRDRKRWDKADANKDDHLDKKEFTAFLHPEDFEHMRDIVVDETLEDIDKNKDGVISIEEYIADMWPQQDDEEEPEWVKTEREQFSNFRDKDKDGQMDREEVKNWIIPPDYDHSEAEAKHLIFESDVDRDGKLTKKEITDKHDLFVGSQATDFGEALTHDEF